ncbi:MAG: hypothetical protein ABI878_06885 [Acidobacteriota bacterium]
MLDFENKLVEIRLLPNEQVAVDGFIDNLSNNYEKEWNITALCMISTNGSVCAKGEEVYKSFHPIRKSWYTFGPAVIRFEYDYR